MAGRPWRAAVAEAAVAERPGRGGWGGAAVAKGRGGGGRGQAVVGGDVRARAPRWRRPGPISRGADHASIVLWSPADPAMAMMRRGLAFSAIGMRRVSTPAS